MSSVDELLAQSAALGDTWSEARKQCAIRVCTLARSLPVASRDELAGAWAAQLRDSSDWRHSEGLCEALARLPCQATAEAVISKGLAHESSHVRAAAVRAIAAIGGCERLVALAISKARHAHELAGLVAGLEALGAAVLDVETVRQLLGHEASTVRLATAGLVHRLRDDTVFDDDFTCERRTEGAFVALDALVRDEAARSLVADASSLFCDRAALVCEQFFDAGSFEVRRAARQLAASLAVADVACARATALAWTDWSASSYVASAGADFARFLLEHVKDVPRRWGRSHVGAGDDAPGVERVERAVAAADPSRLRRLARRFRDKVALPTLERGKLVPLRLAAFLAPTRHPLLSVVEWRTSPPPLMPDLVLAVSFTADRALRTATEVLCSHESPYRGRAVAIAIRVALARCSPAAPLQACLANELEPLDWREKPGSLDELQRARRLLPSLTSRLAALCATAPSDHASLVKALVYAAAFAQKTGGDDITGVLVSTLVRWEAPPRGGDDDWDEWDDDEEEAPMIDTQALVTELKPW